MTNLNEFLEQLEINGRTVDERSLRVGGLDPEDYPRFDDAHFVSGSYEDGEELSDEELEYLTDNHYWVLNQMALDQYNDRVPDNHKDAGMLDEGPGDLGKRSPGERVSTADSILDILTPAQLEQVLRPITFDREAMFVDHQDVYDALYDHYAEIPEVDGGMPYGVAKGRTGSPDQWIEERVWADFGDEIEEYLESMTGQSADRDLDPPDEFFELRRLAGLPIQESNGLSAAMKRDAKIRDRNIKKAQRWMKQTGKDAEAARKEFDLLKGDLKHLEEAPGDSLRRKLNKFLMWGETSPKEMQQRVRDMDDESLIKLYDLVSDSGVSDGSERQVQMRMIDQELKRRHGLTPRGNVRESEEMITKRVVGHKDREARMMQRELLKIRDYAQELCDMLDDLQDGDFPHWWQAKLVKAGDYMSTIKHFLEGERELDLRGGGEIDHISVDPIAQELLSLGEDNDDFDQLNARRR